MANEFTISSGDAADYVYGADTSSFGYPAYGVSGNSLSSTNNYGTGSLASWSSPSNSSSYVSSSGYGDGSSSYGSSYGSSGYGDSSYGGGTGTGNSASGSGGGGYSNVYSGSGTGSSGSSPDSSFFSTSSFSVPLSEALSWAKNPIFNFSQGGQPNSLGGGSLSQLGGQFGGQSNQIGTGYAAYGMGNSANWAAPTSYQGKTLASIIQQLESSGGENISKSKFQNPYYNQGAQFIKDYGSGAEGVNAFAQKVLNKNRNASVGDYYANYVMGTGNPGQYTYSNLQTTKMPGAQGAASNFAQHAGVSASTPLSSVPTTGGNYVNANYSSPSAAAAAYSGGGGGSSSGGQTASQAGNYSASQSGNYSSQNQLGGGGLSQFGK